mmetsp:Transcript_10041/g.14201  ORF Transcript_10041/g.14201 Transcript_10041/m.14201 type:complete len:1463 (+) Transcript_10041:125-4513(+)|eukprot:CAMPEP_0184870024 /NCGR_PEP_ID=MMETSP0580-20130426/36189_1 /TAXON_ID=1118495 /ORGANISM="Dactyliosolen fragilissimus" /LENGTH=1462 /DNA_ID=CAMNT_0027371895 /DNA_START=52 /DNA_END=4440 /DNA_ORIENTATION=+
MHTNNFVKNPKRSGLSPQKRKPTQQRFQFYEIDDPGTNATFSYSPANKQNANGEKRKETNDINSFRHDALTPSISLEKGAVHNTEDSKVSITSERNQDSILSTNNATLPKHSKGQSTPTTSNITTDPSIPEILEDLARESSRNDGASISNITGDAAVRGKNDRFEALDAPEIENNDFRILSPHLRDNKKVGEITSVHNEGSGDKVFQAGTTCDIDHYPDGDKEASSEGGAGNKSVDEMKDKNLRYQEYQLSSEQSVPDKNSYDSGTAGESIEADVKDALEHLHLRWHSRHIAQVSKEPYGSSDMTDSQSTTLEQLQAEEEEWKLRRDQMADFAQRLSESIPPETPSPTSNNTASTARTNLPHNIWNVATSSNPGVNVKTPGKSHPLPRHPSSDSRRTLTPVNMQTFLPVAANGQLITASRFDNRLLSPAVDVRKSIQLGNDMFRPHGFDSYESDAGIELANPIFSKIGSSGHSGCGNGSFEILSPTRGNYTFTNSNNTSLTQSFYPVVPYSPGPERSKEIPRTHTDGGEAMNGDENPAIPHMGGHSESSGNIYLSTFIEEQVTLGIEKVLLTILDRAYNSKKEGNMKDHIDSIIKSLHDSAIRTYQFQPTAQMSESTKQINDIRAKVDSLLIDENTNDQVHHANVDIAKKMYELSSSKQIDEKEKVSDVIGNISEPNVERSPMEVSDQLAENDTLVDKYTKINIESDFQANLEDDKESNEILEKDTNEFESEEKTQESKVLGPLSIEMGGTTGVVLDTEDLCNSDFSYDDEDDCESEEKEGHKDDDEEESLFHGLDGVITEDISPGKNVDESKIVSSPSIFTSIKTAVKGGPGGIMAVLSGDNGDSFNQSKDSLSVEVGINSLARALYSHLLPHDKEGKYSGTKTIGGWITSKLKTGEDSTRKSDDIDINWDDNDPEEPGYLVHSLSQSELDSVEEEFENISLIMMRKGGGSSKERTKGAHQSKQRDVPREDFSRSIDDGLDGDLEEAEELLDSRQKGDSIAVEENEDTILPVDESNLSLMTSDNYEASDNKDNFENNEEQSDSSILSLEESEDANSNSLVANPLFPSVKSGGKGNLGELELYHLPIIYKAHQTGFEPTKDLVLQSGTIFAGQYFVQSELGSAAFSTAYRCVDLTSGKKSEDGEEYYDEVCLKVIKNTKDFFDQSLDEIKILELLRQTGKCNDNNIVEMICFFYHKEHLIIVTELLRQNLFEFGKYIIENNEPKYFTRSRLCYIARQCLVALNFVHDMGLVHSDIKPENILLASYSKAKVKVIDFGSSCYLSDRQSSYIQSRSYRAPEVILGLPYDGKIDIWSLGCVIAEMYTGQVTFQNDSIVSMLCRIEAICGRFPQYMIEEGRQSGQFFTSTGLLYERFDSDDKQGTEYNIYQPKTTKMASRLGFESNLMERRRTTWEDDEKALFVDFIKRMLTIDPKSRPTASEALEHPWILSGFNLTEEDILYPPEK